MSDEERWTALNVADVTVIKSTPISLRTLMNALTPEEYVTARTILNTAAESNLLMQDAVAILANVGEWTDSGLDIGAAAARGMVDALFIGDYAALGTKIKALAESTVSQIEAWAQDGTIVRQGHLATARTLAEA